MGQWWSTKLEDGNKIELSNLFRSTGRFTSRYLQVPMGLIKVLEDLLDRYLQDPMGLIKVHVSCL